MLVISQELILIAPDSN